MLKRKNKKLPVTRTPSTASRPANVFSYRAGRSPSDAPTGRNTVQQPKSISAIAWWHHIPTFIGAGCILVGLGYLLTLNITPRFMPLNSDNSSLLQPMEVYEREGSVVFANSLLSRSKLSIDTEKLASNLHDQFPELENITVIVPLFSRRPIVQFEAARPAFMLTNQSGAYVIATDGRAVLKASEAPSSIRDNLVVVTDEVQLQIQKGKPALPTNSISFITEVVAEFQAKNIAIKSITLPTAANQVNVYLKDAPYYAKFDTEGDARLQAGTFISVKEKLEQGKTPPAEYIDVRLDGRAYYK